MQVACYQGEARGTVGVRFYQGSGKCFECAGDQLLLHLGSAFAIAED